MSACEPCWNEAYRQSRMLGGSQVDYYTQLIATIDGHPHDTTPSVSAPTAHEGGNIAAVLAALQSVPGLRRPGTITDRMKHAIAAALAPLIAEREAKAWDECKHAYFHTDQHPVVNPYRAALAPETPDA